MLKNAKLEYLNKFKKLAFAVSGGKDSMALLHLALNSLNKNKILVVTVHHNLRDDEGKRDRDFVIDFCKKQNIECLVFEEHIFEYASDNKYTIEQAARIRRQEIFKSIVDSKKADRVVIAHHKDDQVESILMHVFRGSGLQGLVGMELDTGYFVRPMLDVAASEITEYIRQNNIMYVEDSTNATLDYSRNRIRNVVMKEIEVAYPNFKDNVVRLSQIAARAAQYINDSAPEIYTEQDCVYLNIKDIENRNIATDQAIIDAIDKISTKVNLEKTHIDSIYDLLERENNKSLNLPFDTICAKEYDKLIFYKDEKIEFQPFEVAEGEYILGKYKLNISLEEKEGLRVDFDKIKGAVVRLKQEKDSFKKFKGGRKSLGDFLTDKKIPKRKRNSIIVIAKDSEVLTVCGIEIADDVKIDENTKTIAYISIERTK